VLINIISKTWAILLMQRSFEFCLKSQIMFRLSDICTNTFVGFKSALDAADLRNYPSGRRLSLGFLISER
jgi:hypothetical protein